MENIEFKTKKRWWIKPFHFILVLFVGIFIGNLIYGSGTNSSSDLLKYSGISNETLIYGDTGLPKNCRAVIKANIEAYHAGEYSPDDIISSIDRNCGEFGYAW